MQRNKRDALSSTRRFRVAPKKDTLSRRMFGRALPRKPKTTVFRASQANKKPQEIVSGAQRAWKFRRNAKIFFMIVVLGGGLGLLALFCYRLLSGSDIFILTDIQVIGAKARTGQQIMEMAGLYQGMNRFDLDIAEAERRISADPWIQEAHIQTRWPSGLRIAIQEHQPFALASLEEEGEKKLYYLNRSGNLFAEVERGQNLDFPVINGVRPQIDLLDRHFVAGSLAEKALQLLALTDRGSVVLPIQVVSEIYIDAENGLTLYLMDQPFPVYLGKCQEKGELRTKHHRLTIILERLSAKKQIEAVKEIRMDYTQNKVLVVGANIDG